MQDEIYDRYYQAGRADLHAGLDRGFQAVGHFIATTFNAIHDVQFSAPWKKADRRKSGKRAGIA